MGVQKPFRRTCRQFVDGEYTEGGRWRYIVHPGFATAPTQYVRAFTVIQSDLLNLFEYIEPADRNLEAYSYRTHELLMRICIEVEANFKAILDDNGYPKNNNLTMSDYRKVDATHRLSSYRVKLPVWHGKQDVRKPYSSFAATGKNPKWYDAYNVSKHNRHNRFAEANFDSVIDSMCGLTALISAQFYNEDSFFSEYLIVGGQNDVYETAVGGYLRVQFPEDWPLIDRYDFDWQQLKHSADPFQSLTF